MTKTATLLLAALVAAPALSQVPTPTKGARLPMTIKLDASALKALQLPPPMTTLHQFDEAVAAVKAQAENLKAAQKNFDDAERACATRTYSAQDMREAGCLDTETVAQCTVKLYDRCTRPSRRSYRLHHRNFITAVDALNQKARSLAIPPETP
ncbi:MAG TPA: hypothetical protein PLB01_08240 [Thermoanaerobaculia bacterium]|nr:hypothetical protein [Thermoanaerobaculia bacterium]